MARAAWVAAAVFLASALLLSAAMTLPPAAPVRASASAVASNGWTNVTGGLAPPAVGGGMMTYDAKADLFVLFGGSDGNPTNGTWTLDPKTSTWTQLHPATSPPARVDGMFAYDARTDALVLFGGWQEPADEVYTRLGDTWVFYLGNDTWVPRRPAASPTPRSDAAVAYDPQDDLLLLFGGFNGTAYLGDTWRYDVPSATWTTVPSPVAPSRRADGRMTYDPATAAFYLFGGNDYSGPNFTFHHLQDTWRYVVRDRAWSELSPSRSPGARDYAVFAADTDAHELLSLGGYGDGTVLGELWAFNTTDLDWRNLTAPGGPTPRMAAIGEYSPVENVYVVFSGGDKLSAKDDTWFYRFPGPLAGTVAVSSGSRVADSSVDFHAEVLGGSGVYPQLRWDFGDGGNASGSDVSHAFRAAGVYTVNFQASDTMGDTLNLSMTVSVSGGTPLWTALAGVAVPVVAVIVILAWTARRRRGRTGKGT